jgi:hypothetical protein
VCVSFLHRCLCSLLLARPSSRRRSVGRYYYIVAVSFPHTHRSSLGVRQFARSQHFFAVHCRRQVPTECQLLLTGAVAPLVANLIEARLGPPPPLPLPLLTPSTIDRRPSSSESSSSSSAVGNIYICHVSRGFYTTREKTNALVQKVSKSNLFFSFLYLRSALTLIFDRIRVVVVVGGGMVSPFLFVV